MRTFASSLDFGKVGESVISQWMQSRGSDVLPVYEKEIDDGKGPRLFTRVGNIVAPDMVAFRDGCATWVEAKHKRAFSWYGKGGYFVTGIDLRHYDEYIRVALQTKIPVWLIFYHPNTVTRRSDVRKYNAPARSPSGLFGGNVVSLQGCISHTSDRWGKSGMVYWAHYSLMRLATMDQVLSVVDPESSAMVEAYENMIG